MLDNKKQIPGKISEQRKQINKKFFTISRQFQVNRQLKIKADQPKNKIDHTSAETNLTIIREGNKISLATDQAIFIVH